MPDATHGVPVHRAPIAEILGVYNYSANLNLDRPNVEPGTWYPADVAVARDAVIEAARELANVRGGGHANSRVASAKTILRRALDRLDAIRGAA